MKNFLHTLSYFLILLLLASVTGTTYGQCLCSGGVTPNVLEHRSQLLPTSASTSIVSFPKFPIALGTLNCVSLYDTLSIEAQTGARNLDPFSGHEPSFQLTLTTSVKGPNPLAPSITMNDLINVMYGPDSLQIYGTPGDSITYGPDTVYNKVVKQRNSSTGLGEYYSGPGDVEFTYDISGGAIPVFDGTNYSVTVRTNTWGGFRLVYYWCPFLTLATDIVNFSASRNNNGILLQWITENKTPGSAYTIEHSFDGSTFTNIGTSDPNAVNGNINGKHEFQYSPDKLITGKLYFRIKQVDASGKISYSPIRSVDMNINSPAAFVVYPNPVSRQISMQFDRSLTGDYVVEIANLTGQAVYNRKIKLNNVNNVQIAIGDPPPSGVYYLKMTNTKTKLSYTNKLIIRR